MKIILKKDIANLGDAGEVVEVKTGYALNYLVPQGFAAVGTPSALKQHEETIRQRAHKEAKNIAEAEAKAAKLSAQTVNVPVKVGESGKLYGSVTAAQVAAALVELGFEVARDISATASQSPTGERAMLQRDLSLPLIRQEKNASTKYICQ